MRPPIFSDATPELVEFGLVCTTQASILHVCRFPGDRAPRSIWNQLDMLSNRVLIAKEPGGKQAAQDNKVFARRSLLLGKALPANNRNSEGIEVIRRYPAPCNHASGASRDVRLACD